MVDVAQEFVGGCRAIVSVAGKQPADQSRRLAEALVSLAERVRPCSRCFNLTEEELCSICRDPRRDAATICVVEQASDIGAIERSGEFRGLYHVLGGRLSPLDPYIHIFQGYLGLAHYVNGSHEEAVYWSRRSLAKSPRFVAVLRQIIVSLSALGRLEEARVAAMQLVDLVPGFRVRTFMASYPIKDAQRAAAYAAQLLAAGLPE